MKDFKKLLYILSLFLVFTACSSDDNENDGNGNDANLNKNIITTDKAVSRLEFPKLKGGNSVIIVHRISDNNTFDQDNVNYCVEWDCDKKSQRWSCYQLHTGYNGNYSRVVSSYPNDPNLTTGTYWEEDLFRGSGFDHGHICPSADRTFSYDANYQTFYMTNMQPQYHRFNGYSTTGNDRGEGLWVRLENLVRGWSPRSKTDTLYVCKGGTIDDEKNIISRIQDKLIVPKYFFMACLLKNSQGYRAIGFWMEQKNEWATNDDLTDYVVTIDRLEELTGIDFFCNLPDETENKVERSVAINAWSIK